MGGTGEGGGGITFIVESVDPVDACTFVVSSEDEKVFGVFDFICEEETYCF